ncbi:unnamed protein product [Auanema sp. JU1783]|nr:unnamed protein product [Auanema sp. JU1783]
MAKNSMKSLKFYLDPCCPRSFRFFKRMEMHLTPSVVVPVSNFKISFMKKIIESSKEAVEQDLKKDFQEMFVAHASEGCDAAHVEIYKTYLEHRSLFPHNYITAIKEHFPSLLIKNFSILGHRLYNENLPVHRGCYLSTCARLGGLELRESEYIISRLTHRSYRKTVDKIAMDCAKRGMPMAPYVELITNEDEENSKILTDMNEEEISSYLIK